MCICIILSYIHVLVYYTVLRPCHLSPAARRREGYPSDRAGGGRHLETTETGS